MTTTLRIDLEARDPEELAEWLGRLSVALGAKGLSVTPVDLSNAEDGSAVAAVEKADPPKRKRGRPAKKKVEEAQPEVREDAASEDAPSEPEAETHPVEDNVVDDLSPEEARTKGLALMQDFFRGDNDTAMEAVAKLQAKYKVKQFANVPLEQAHDFLADVKLATSGNQEAAA